MYIKLKNLTKGFDGTDLYKNQTMNISLDGITCLIGESGVGKSTLINLIIKKDRDYLGEIEIYDNDDYSISFMPQSDKLLDTMTVFENIESFCELENIVKINDILEKLDILDLRNSFVSEISGGQRQRVNLARALINKPKLIILDEPTGSLDDKTTVEICEVLKIIEKTDVNFLIITHDTRIIETFGQVIEIKDCNIYSNNLSSKRNEKTNYISNNIDLNFLYTNSVKRNKSNYIFNKLIITFALFILVMINVFIISDNNKFVDTVNGYYGETGGIIQATHSNDLIIGCELIMNYNICAGGDMHLPGAKDFSQKELDYLNEFEGFENLVPVYGNGFNNNLTYNGTSISATKLKDRALSYSQATGDDHFSSDDDSSLRLQASELIAQPSVISNFGSFALDENILSPLYGEVHDLDNDEIIISEYLARVFAFEENVGVEDLVGMTITLDDEDIIELPGVDSKKDKSVSEAGKIDYRIAWIYPSDSFDTVYIPPSDKSIDVQLDYNNLTANDLLYLLPESDYTKHARESYCSMYKEMTSKMQGDDYKLGEALLDDCSSYENMKKSVGTAYESIYYNLKTGYSQEDLTKYINNGPDTLKYRTNMNPEVLLANKDYNSNFTRNRNRVIVIILFTLIIYVLQKMYFKIIIEELKLLILFDVKQKAIKKYLLRHYANMMYSSLLISIFTASFISMILNYFVMKIYINMSNIFSIILVLMLVSVITLYMHLIRINKLDARKEFHD